MTVIGAGDSRVVLRIVVEATDPDGVSRLWIAAVDRQSPPPP
jgi:hypothetical protein